MVFGESGVEGVFGGFLEKYLEVLKGFGKLKSSG